MSKRWPAISKKLVAAIGDFQTSFSQYPTHATHITRAALLAGFERIIAVGGDGTLSHVVNGFFSEGNHKQPINPDAILAVITGGTGCDAARSLPIGVGLEQQLNTLNNNSFKKIDLGRVETTLEDGSSQVQMFLNMCSFGLSADVVTAVNKAGVGKTISGRFAYLLSAMKALMFNQNRKVSMKLNNKQLVEETVALVGVANGAYCGGGIWLAPMAKMDDGSLDTIVVGNVGFLDLLRYLRRLFKGEHLSHPKINHYPVTKFSAHTSNAGGKFMPVEADGEFIGYLPCHMDIMTKAIKVQILDQ